MRDLLELHYNSALTLKKEIAEKEEKLQKNNEAILVNGQVPDKYKPAYQRFLNNLEELRKRLDGVEKVLGPIEEMYIFQVITGNLLFEKGDGIEPFLKKLEELKDREKENIRKATTDLDLEELDNILIPLRSEFLDEMFFEYERYSKTLSFNKAA